MNIVYVANYILGESQLHDAIWVVIALIATPLIMGVTVAWYINRRLRHFTNGITALQTGNHNVRVPLSGIREFDEVTEKFNLLVERLNQEEELRKNLISDTSHELNTPLAATLSQLSAMQDNILEITPERLQILREQIERLIDMTAQLDAYTRARQPSDIRNHLLLRNLCNTVAKRMEKLLDTAQIKLEINIDPKYTVTGSQEASEQILTNIIQNSIKYSKGTSITISTADRGFTISDNGIGIPAKDRKHIFERFYRVDKSRSQSTGGLGLGLAIVNELAIQQNWQISTQDNEPGLTIRFIVK